MYSLSTHIYYVTLSAAVAVEHSTTASYPIFDQSTWLTLFAVLFRAYLINWTAYKLIASSIHIQALSLFLRHILGIIGLV